jgi:hypothetical protein
MPLLISTLGYEMRDTLFPPVLETVPELTAAGAQTTTEALLVGRHPGPRFVVGHCQLIESLPGACFRFAPGC